VIFAAAAQLSGADRTPPGRRATSFTFSHDWVGGPQVGYVKTDAVYCNVPPQLRNDLTVQSAIAVSGAAFASAMGRQARAMQTLFALSNARLGTWLPNPAWLADRSAELPAWGGPRLPRVRRLTYLIREVFGIYDDDDRLVLVTDGGHYDNLGLVELLRHRCRRVFVVDASADAPPLANTLAQAITLAREELGIEIELQDPLRLVPGSGQALDPQHVLSGLNARLSQTTVIRGKIVYPTEFKVPGCGAASKQGELIVMKAGLTRTMPYDVLAYANSHPSFPRDSTGDQWFDHGQFDAYHALGRYLGEQGVRAAGLEVTV
jgi:hypothetical protein